MYIWYARRRRRAGIRHRRVLIRLFIILFLVLNFVDTAAQSKAKMNDLPIVVGWLDHEVWLFAPIMEMTECSVPHSLDDDDEDDDDEWNQQSFARSIRNTFYRINVIMNN